MNYQFLMALSVMMIAAALVSLAVEFRKANAKPAVPGSNDFVELHYKLWNKRVLVRRADVTVVWEKQQHCWYYVSVMVKKKEVFTVPFQYGTSNTSNALCDIKSKALYDYIKIHLAVSDKIVIDTTEWQKQLKKLQSDEKD